MTLAEMLRTANPGLQGYLQQRHLPWLEETALPSLPVSPSELVNLYGWLMFEPECKDLAPVGWADEMAASAIRWMIETKDENDLAALALAGNAGGPLTTAALRDLLKVLTREGKDRWFLCQRLLKLEGPAAAAAVYSARKGLNAHSKGGLDRILDECREEHQLSEEAWALLIAERTEALEAFAQKGRGFQLAEFRVLAQHAVLGPLLAGLVFAVRNEAGEHARCFVLPDAPALAPGEAVVIARASMLSAAERAAWTTRLQAPPPFDQWAFAEKVLDTTQLTADPLTLFTHLEARGWQRGPAIEGVIRTHTKVFPEAGVQAVLEYTGVPVGFGGTWTRQRLTQCRFEPRESRLAASAVAEDMEGLAA